jgi:hypothetical protein
MFRNAVNSLALRGRLVEIAATGCRETEGPDCRSEADRLLRRHSALPKAADPRSLCHAGSHARAGPSFPLFGLIQGKVIVGLQEPAG